jgi:hypothetical protein
MVVRRPRLTPKSPGPLTGVSCSARQSCLAVGYSVIQVPEDGGPDQIEQPIAERLSGSTWTLATLPALARTYSGTQLQAMSCLTASACVAAGFAAAPYETPVLDTTGR